MIHNDYVHLSPPCNQAEAKNFILEDNFHYPHKLILLESFIRTLLKDNEPTSWKYLLEAWATGYICGYLDVGVDVLDKCGDEMVKAWYNKAIRRDKGGLDKSRTKRTGRLQPGGGQVRQS